MTQYVPKEWIPGETITADALNHLENGVAGINAVPDEVVYQGRNTEYNEPRVITRFKGDFSNLQDLPPWSYFSAAGSVLQPLLGDFSWTLEEEKTYIIFKKSLLSFNGDAIVYDLIRMNGREHWVGYLTSQVENIVWSDVSYKNVEAAEEAISTLLNARAVDRTLDVPKLFVYTKFQPSPGFWTASGSLANTKLTHTDLLSVIPGGPCFLVNTVNQDVQGAYFDKNGNWLSPILLSQITDYDYPSPDKSGTVTAYVPLKTFTVPEDAYFVSLNIPSSHQYRLFLASKPVFPYQNTENLLVMRQDDGRLPQGRRLCVIGPSTVMIDRWYVKELSQYLCGWQEYVYPLFDSFESYGYSGGSMGSGYTEYPSIYDRIVTAGVDLSGYDTFIIFGSKNGLTATGVGSWGDISTPPEEHDSYMGGLRNLCEYIYSQNPMACIYLCTLPYSGSYYTSPLTYQPLVNSVNQLTREMANAMGMHLIDLALESGFNQKNYYNESDPTAGYTYDGTHFNQQGSYVIGRCVRNAVAPGR